MSTDVNQFFADLDAGVFEEKLSRMLSEVAGAVIDHSNRGKVTGNVTISLNMSRIGNSYQVQCDHKLSYSRPTAKGKITEENTTSTPMYVGERGKLTLFPEGQGQMFDKKGQFNQKHNKENN